jgi:hypothetical protein
MCEPEISTTTTSTTTIIPEYFSYTVSSGTQICYGGYTNIGGSITTVNIYSEVSKDDWTIGTRLYSNESLTTLINSNFIRNAVGSTIFVSMTTPGIIDDIIPQMTPC